MPAASSPRQAAVSPWFEKAGAQAMREWEQRLLSEQMRGFPSQPWLWLAPDASWLPDSPPQGRGLRLHRNPQTPGWVGDVRCSLPLPLPSESIKAIVIEHPAAEELEPMLSECARVLMPGGRVWVTLLNRCSPYRAHWQWQGARPPSVTRCRTLLQRQGIRCRSLRHYGPLWTQSGNTPGTALPALRALCVLEAEKRTEAYIGPIKASRVSWRGPVAT